MVFLVTPVFFSNAQCRCKTTAAFQSTSTKAWKQLFKQPLRGNRKNLGGSRKNFTVEFQWIRNREYENLTKKVSRLLIKKRALPIEAVTKHQVLDDKIRNLRESRMTIPGRV